MTNNTHNTNETILNVPLTSIAVDLAWNARSGAWKRDCGFEAESAFEELKESIRACGVKDPVKLRPVVGGKLPFALVSEFRRYGACEELGLATIPAVVRAMTDTEARLENAREKTARSDLKPPDLAWAVAEAAKLGLTDTDIARAIGMTQEYVSKLHRIMSDVSPAVTARWRSSACLVTVDAMYGLVKAPKEQQDAMYMRLLRGIRDDEGRRHKRTRLQRLAKDAHALGSKLRVLERMKCIVLVS
jgi:ParB/RepB/Spo0J family partition protein